MIGLIYSRWKNVRSLNFFKTLFGTFIRVLMRYIYLATCLTCRPEKVLKKSGGPRTSVFFAGTSTSVSSYKGKPTHHSRAMELFCFNWK